MNFLTNDLIFDFNSLQTEQREVATVLSLQKEPTGIEMIYFLKLLGSEFEKKGLSAVRIVDGDVSGDGSEFKGDLVKRFSIVIGWYQVSYC